LPLPSPGTIAGRAACALVLPALALGVWSSARLASADNQFRINTPQSLAEAVRIEPGNAAYHQLLAEHLEGMGQDPAPEREKAALLSPLDSSYWTELGLMAEVRSDFPTAERYLLKAASVDRKFGPRWALMNFYFRQQRPAEFWQWTSATLGMAYGELAGVFRLCWIMSGDAEAIRARLPHDNYVRTEYLRFLINDEHWQGAGPTAREVSARATEEDRELLLYYCDGAVRHNLPSAVEVWNTMVRRRLEPFEPLDPAAGAIVTDGEFRTSPIERGFDWRVANAEGVTVTFGLLNSGVSVELSGAQDQEVAILTELMPTEKGKNYRLDYDYSFDESADGGISRQASGLAWEVRDPATKAVIATSEDLKASPNPPKGSFAFAAPGDSAILSLRYSRAPGTIRHEEKFTIRKISSRVQP
jgi:hypothetical protein